VSSQNVFNSINRAKIRTINMTKTSILRSSAALLLGLAILPQVQAAPSALSQYATSWAGSFDNRRIGVFIESIQQNQVKGYSILGATKQSFAGTVQPMGAGQYKIIAKEIGSPATAGVFEFTLNTAKKSEIEGSWVSNQSTVKPKFFSLKAMQCHYNANAGGYPEGSTRLLKDADLQVNKNELQYMRNVIYARHNYSFANSAIAAYFTEADWYIPCSLDVSKQLTKIEQENIKRIKLMEPYAENADWGR
jgi:hypothetical protein